MKNFLTIDWEEWDDTASMEGWRGKGDGIKLLQPATEKIISMISPFTATFFVLAGHVKEYASLIRLISKEGHEIALHGLRHIPLSRYTPAIFRDEILTAKKIVEDSTGARVRGFRAPNFSMRLEHRWAMDVLLDCGFEYDASMTAAVFSRSLKQGALPIREISRSGVGTGLLSLPFGGGGFLRLYPYGLTRSWISQLNEHGVRAMVYIHPWEIDGRWRNVRGLPFRARAVMGSGLDSVEEKFKGILKDFTFSSIQEILKEY